MPAAKIAAYIVRHLEQHLRIEHPLAEAVGRADEHLGHHDDDQREGDAGAHADEGLRQRFEQRHVDHDAQPAAPMTRAASLRVLRAFMTP